VLVEEFAEWLLAGVVDAGYKVLEGFLGLGKYYQRWALWLKQD